MMSPSVLSIVEYMPMMPREIEVIIKIAVIATVMLR